MEITKTDQTINVNASTSNGDLTYSLNYSIQDSKIVNLNVQITKSVTDTNGIKSIINIGNINSNDINKTFNFNENSNSTDKKQVIDDLDAIYSNIII